MGSQHPTAPQSGQLIETEPAPRDPEVAGCTTQGEFEIELMLTEEGGGIEIRGALTDPASYPEFAEGFPTIVWPFGFSAESLPQVAIFDDAGEIVATANEPVRLGGGTIDDLGYHVCLIDGEPHFGAAETG